MIVIAFEDDPHQIQQGQQAQQPPVAIQHGHGADVMLLHPLIDLGEHFILVGNHRIAAAKVSHFRPDVHHHARRSQLGTPQSIFGSLIGRTATGGHGLGASGALKQIGIGQRRADGVGIGVAVAKNVYRHDGIRVGAAGTAGAWPARILTDRRQSSQWAGSTNDWPNAAPHGVLVVQRLSRLAVSAGSAMMLGCHREAQGALAAGSLLLATRKEFCADVQQAMEVFSIEGAVDAGPPGRNHSWWPSCCSAGIDEAEEAQQFLEAKLTSACPRNAARRTTSGRVHWPGDHCGQPIVVHGDYDADGMTGTAILYRCLRLLEAQVNYFLPNRLEEGYGLAAETVEKHAANGKQMIITVDCGIASCQAASVARRLGLSLIVTDHHQFADQLPDADAIVHPALPGQAYPFTQLRRRGLQIGSALCQQQAGGGRVSEPCRDFLCRRSAWRQLARLPTRCL